jgi:glycine/D-amino acid oxidase-like deaminating enzyme
VRRPRAPQRWQQPGDYVSLWMEEALRGEPAAGTSPGPGPSPDPLPASADVVIVGGGFTGLWTAIRLLERQQDLSVCLIEARYCGWGASGRNGGIAEPSWAKFPVMVRLYGQAEALRLGQAIHNGLGELERFCSEHHLDAELRRAGNLWIASNQEQLGAWDKARSAIEAAGERHLELMGRKEASELTGSPLALGGVRELDAATVQPAKLARGLRRVALEKGAAIFEDTPMRRLDTSTIPPAVVTPRGTIRAGKVVLAMNAWAASMRPLRPYIFVTSSDIIATVPGVAARAGESLAGGVAISDSSRLILYWRSTPDGRVVFGKGGGWMSIANRVDGRFTGTSALAESVESRFRRLYPDLRDVPVERSWNGPIDYSSTGLAYFGPLDDRQRDVLVAIGYSGMGVVQTVLGGQILASLTLGTDDDYASLPLTSRWPSSLPSEPFRSLGAPLVKAAVTRKERALDAEVRPSRLATLVAGLDPTAAPTGS